MAVQKLEMTDHSGLQDLYVLPYSGVCCSLMQSGKGVGQAACTHAGSCIPSSHEIENTDLCNQNMESATKSTVYSLQQWGSCNPWMYLPSNSKS